MSLRITKLVSSFFSKARKTKTCHGDSHSCSKNSSNIKKNKSNILLFPLISLIGLISLIWFLIRVIPKPSRATYPCQRVAFPLASGFIIWLLGLTASAVACRRASRLFAQARYIAAGICLVAGVSFVWLMLVSNARSANAPPASDPPIVNQPIGLGKGVHPGRVAWIHDSNAAKWTGSDNVTSQPYWHSDTSTNPQVVSEMMSKSLRLLSGADSDSTAWDAIFRNFNEQMGRGSIGYKPGEKIAIKINFVLTLSNSNGIKSNSSLDQIDCSPQLAISLLTQLTDVVGVNPGDISIGDPSAYMPNYWYDMVVSKCPGVIYLTKSGSNLYGRTSVTYDNTAPFYWSDPVTSRVQGTTQDYIPTHFSQAKYFINFAILKSHTQNGMTVTAKNHFGSLRTPTANGYYNMHYSRSMETPGMGHYRCLVDLVGHPKLGGKTLLCLIDGLYAGRGWDSHPIKWKMAPFNNNWPSSIFLSQDPVAADSVAYDFLRSEWTNYTPGLPDGDSRNLSGLPQMSGTEDFLHEAALADNPPSRAMYGTVYDPNHDGGLKSLGVHENWNNAIDKQYTRNLGTGYGIELVFPSPYATANGPVHNINRGEKYDYIQHAINAASTDDHIIVSPGTYNENIDFKGKRLTLSSANPNSPAIVASTIIKGSDKTVTFAGGEDANSIITGFTITDANAGIYCNGTSPSISKCRITGNHIYGIELRNNASPNISYCEILCNTGSGLAITNGQLSLLSKPLINHSIIAANRLHGIVCDMPLVDNCTIAANGLRGISGQSPNVTNSIIFYNSRGTDNIQMDGSSALVTYSDIQGGWAGTANINLDPCFAEIGLWDVNGTPDDTTDDTCFAGDYHLLSMAGRWVPSHPSMTDPNLQISGWTLDEVSSPCIDAGDPNSSWGDELWTHGKRLNMGVYGGTLQASLSSSNAGDIRDLNSDNTVTWNDVLQLTKKWDSTNAPLKEDLNLDCIVDANDLLFFDGNWQADSNNAVPQFEIVADVNVTAGDLISFSVSASDTNSDNLVYIAAGLPETASFSAQTLTWTPEQEGTFKVTFIASDNKSLTYITILITVEPENPVQ